MNTRRAIFLTLLIPAAVYSVFYLFSRFYKPSSLPDGVSYRTTDFSVRGEDAVLIRGEVSSPAIPIEILIFAADEALDRDWNSSAVSMNTGEKLADLYASRGRTVFRYDQRETGESVNSGRTHPDISLLVEDLIVVYRFAVSRSKAEEKPVPISIFAHGLGCTTAITAMTEFEMPVKTLYLTGCLYSGTLLEDYGKRIINKMERSGASTEALRLAELGLNAWLKQIVALSDRAGNHDSAPDIDRLIPQVSNGMDELDLKAFRKALFYLQSPEKTGWTMQAARISFFSLLEKIRGRKAEAIVHIVGEFDEEIPLASIIPASKKALELEKRSGHGYRFLMIKRTNHFFQEADGRAAGDIQIMIDRKNPFIGTSPEFLSAAGL